MKQFKYHKNYIDINWINHIFLHPALFRSFSKKFSDESWGFDMQQKSL